MTREAPAGTGRSARAESTARAPAAHKPWAAAPHQVAAYPSNARIACTPISVNQKLPAAVIHRTTGDDPSLLVRHRFTAAKAPVSR